VIEVNRGQPGKLTDNVFEEFMREDSVIREQIRAFVIQKFPTARKRRFDDEVPLLASGIVDSLGMLDLVDFLEKSFSITLSDDELSPEHFASVRTLAAFVALKKLQVEVPAQ
jgi:acyl carrier protein